ncbi:hypothetical protein MBLNU459_g4564t2 [Dothideomycetes sp. NU459]
MFTARTAIYGALAMLLATASAQDQQSPSEEAEMNRLAIVHGVLMGLAFAVFFPLGAIVLRAFSFHGLVWFHAGWQAFAYAVALAAFGIGVYMAVETQQERTSPADTEVCADPQLTAPNGHPIIGIIVIGVLFLQPLGGVLAHRLFQRRQRATLSGAAHRWLGRVFLLLGVINGGLGLQLSGNTRAGQIAYGVLAAFFYLLWLGVAVFRWYRARRTGATDLHGEEKAEEEEEGGRPL